MNGEIESLNQEINAIQVEISNLRKEEQKITQPASVKAGSPSEVAKSIKAEVLVASQLQPKLDGIRQAITTLQRQLSVKQARLTELNKEQNKQRLESQCTELEEKLIDIGNQINFTSNILDELLQQYKTEGMKYNRLRSEIEKNVVYSAEMTVPFLPAAVKKERMGKFYMRVGTRKIGEKVDLDFKPKPLPVSSIREFLEQSTADTFVWKDGAGKAQLQALQHYHATTPAWDRDRLALINSQIKELEQKLETAKEKVK